MVLRFAKPMLLPEELLVNWEKKKHARSDWSRSRLQEQTNHRHPSGPLRAILSPNETSSFRTGRDEMKWDSG